MLVGSPEWFYKEAQIKERVYYQNKIELLRQEFVDRFSPKKLRSMSGRELLSYVFGKSSDSMLSLLMHEESDYYLFGSAGHYIYLGILYKKDGVWKYYDGHKSVSLSVSDAEIKACQIRDMLLECVNIIVDMGVFESINDYKFLNERIGEVFFSTYPWALKYYQMLFPQYFSGMYADDTLIRALRILGLPIHGKKARIENIGEISLFTRRCDVNNIVFIKIYGDVWGWSDEKSPCQSADENHKNSLQIVERNNMKYYSIPEDYRASYVDTNKEKNAVAVATGKTYDLVVKYGIHAHPVKGYSKGKEYLLPIMSGGKIQYVYKVVNIVEVKPTELEKIESMLTEERMARLENYCSLRMKTIGFKDQEYRFFVLELFDEIIQPFEIRNIQKSIDLALSDIPLFRRRSDTKEQKDVDTHNKETDDKRLGISVEEKDVPGRILFCNIAYMKYYRGITPDDVPCNGGEYVKRTKDAHEKYNFLPENGRVYGFVETKYRNSENGRVGNQLHIERIDGGAKNKDSVEDVTVIFCARKTKFETVIVGWYEHATVYRGRIEKVDYNGVTWGYNITTSTEDAHLIEEKHRDFIISRAKSRNEAGFGQSNVWYADDKKSEEIKKAALDYISYIKDGSYVSLQNEAEEIDRIYEEERLAETERDVVAKARIGQGLFRDKLIQRDGCCVMCGIRNKDLLRASHIKPWKDCKDSDEKLNEDNGLLLCSIHDSLFDRGLICFDDAGKIMISERLSDADREILGMDEGFVLSMSDGMSRFMKWRRKSLLKEVRVVYHKDYGRGTIIDEDKKDITVLFDNGKKQMFMVESLERGILKKRF